MKKRWRNENAAGPHSSIGEYQNYGDDSFYSDEDISIEKRIIQENLRSNANEVPGPGQYYSFQKFSTLKVK